MTWFYHTDIEFDLSDFELSPSDFFSEAWSINASGDMVVGTVGKISDKVINVDGVQVPCSEAGVYHGFTRRSTSWYPEVRRFDYPNAQATSAVGCNDHHDVVGFFRDGDNILRGFVALNGNPSAPSFDLAGFEATEITSDNVIHNGVFDINNDRLVVGVYRDEASHREFGFVAHGDDTTRPVANFISIDMRQIMNDPSILRTRIDGINSHGDIVGSYQDSAGSHSFKWKVVINPDNSLSLDPPTNPEILSLNLNNLVASGINDNEVIVGHGLENSSSGNRFGFLLIPDRLTTPPTASGPFRFIDIDFPTTPITPMPNPMPRRTFGNAMTSGGDIGSTIVGAYRKQLSGSTARRAFIGFFTDNPFVAPGAFINIPGVVQWPGPFTWPPVPPPPTPVPFPWWPTFTLSAIYPTSQNALIGLIVLELTSSLADGESCHRLQVGVLEMVLKEVRKLAENTHCH